MTWDPTKPHGDNLVLNDVESIRNNFAALVGLKGAETDLLDLAGETEDILAVASEKDDVLAVAAQRSPLLDLAGLSSAIIDSRIVDHNLDVVSPVNGWYVRWENRFQLCYYSAIIPYANAARLTYDWTYPAEFAKSFAWLVPSVADDLVNVAGQWANIGPMIADLPGPTSASIRIYNAGASFSEGNFLTCSLFAVGMWNP